MNRAERRKQERALKKKGKPTSHLHSIYSQEDLNNIRAEIKDFLKTYQFKGSPFEESYQKELVYRQFKEMFGANTTTIRLIKEVSENIFTLATNHPIQKQNSSEVIRSDIFLIKEENGWFIKYDKIPYYQNILIAIKETTLTNVMDNEINVGAVFYGYMIPCMNHIVRIAFDRLSLRYDNEWVNL